MQGDNGNDTLLGGDGMDGLIGGYGDDNFVGAGSQILYIYNNILYPSIDAGNDNIDGGIGRDSITDMMGNNIMNGGAGADQFNFYMDERDIFDIWKPSFLQPYLYNHQSTSVIEDFDISEDILRININNLNPNELENNPNVFINFASYSHNTLDDSTIVILENTAANYSVNIFLQNVMLSDLLVSDSLFIVLLKIIAQVVAEQMELISNINGSISRSLMDLV